jgi:hypothetical protein
MTADAEYLIRLRPLTDDRPAEVRFHQVRKHTLRAQRFACLRAETVADRDYAEHRKGAARRPQRNLEPNGNGGRSPAGGPRRPAACSRCSEKG